MVHECPAVGGELDALIRARVGMAHAVSPSEFMRKDGGGLILADESTTVQSLLLGAACGGNSVENLRDLVGQSRADGRGASGRRCDCLPLLRRHVREEVG